MNARVDFRPVDHGDVPFLAQMTLLAAFPPGPLPDDASAMPHVMRWTREWGRVGDAGVVAWLDGERIGAAWCRWHADAIIRDSRGDSIGEIAIAVLPSHRSQGVGGKLLASLDDQAVAAGHRSLSLGVNALNPAIRAYERAGYQVVGEHGSRLTMLKQLGQVGS